MEQHQKDFKFLIVILSGEGSPVTAAVWQKS